MALEPITRQEQIISGKDLKPITRMEKFLKQYGGGSGGGTQSDWNQTDETAPDFLKNKPFGQAENVIFPLGEAEFILMDGMVGLTIPAVIPLNSGDVVRISWDGTIYVNTITDLSGMLVFGNLAYMGMGEPTSEPYIGMIQGETIIIMDVSSQTAVNRTFSLSANYSKKIDPKYIVPCFEVFLAEDDTGIKRVCKIVDGQFVPLTYQELFSPLSNGRTLLLTNDLYTFHSYIQIDTITIYSENQMEYGKVYVQGMSDGSAIVIPYYTAEYTPET